MKRERLLFLSQSLPHPANSGVRIRTFHNLEIFASAFEVRAHCFYRAVGHPTAGHVNAAVQALGQLAPVSAFPIPQEASRSRLVADHARSVMSRRVYTYWTYRSREFLQAVRESVAEFKPDRVHLDSLDLSAALEILPEGVPISVCHHNVESKLLRRRAESLGGPKGLYMDLQAELMQAEEARWMESVTLNYAVSAPDGNDFKRIAPRARLAVAPNGVDTKGREILTGDKPGLVFVGGASWFPNRDALTFFVEDILPLVRARHPSLPITWVGQCTEELKNSMRERHGLQLTGHVPSIVPYLDAASIFIVPMRVGGGTRLKILDAWAHGRAVVSTSVGCEGLDARHRENILIGDTPQSFVAAISELLAAPELRRSIAQSGRATAEETYDWRIIGEGMLRALATAEQEAGVTARSTVTS